MIYNLTSIKTVIYKIITDLGLTNDDITIDDYIEWIGEGLKEIGAYYQFSEKEAVIEVSNYKAELPCDFLQPIEWRNALSGVRLYHNDSLIGFTTTDISRNSFTGNDINLNFNYITTSFESGSIRLQYLAFPVDQEGLPLIPDLPEYREALFWKVCYQLAIRGFSFRNPEMNSINNNRIMWVKACTRARAFANSPDSDMLERLKNNWLRLKPNFNAYLTRFYRIGEPERLNLNGRDYGFNIKFNN